MGKHIKKVFPYPHFTVMILIQLRNLICTEKITYLKVGQEIPLCITINDKISETPKLIKSIDWKKLIKKTRQSLD